MSAANRSEARPSNPASSRHGAVVAQTTSIALELPAEALEAIAQRAAEILAERLAEHDDGWLDTRAAAAYAGCTPNALHKAMAAREVHFEQDCPGGKAWFQRSDIDRWRRGDG